MNKKRIQCQIVTHNNESTIVTCISSILESAFEDIEASFLIIDNNSNDKSLSLIKNSFEELVEVIELEENLGFTGAHNIGARLACQRNIDYLAILNPDLLLEKDCLDRLISNLSVKDRIGASCPLLYRTNQNFEKGKAHIDASGMYFLPSIRHLDRTENFFPSKNKDIHTHQYAIGGSGACLVLHTECIKDVSFPSAVVNSEGLCLFDPSFFAYREDADLALRLQLFGWKTIYVPDAIGYHKRSVRPDKRNEVPALLNKLSVRNRFLLQTNNISLGLFLLNFPSSLFRNCLVIMGCLLKERSSLSGFKEIFNQRGLLLKKRKWIFSKKKVSTLFMKHWFLEEGAFRPALKRIDNKLLGENLNKIKLRIIIINYFQGAEVKSCVDSISKSHLDGLHVDIVIVNNSPEDEEMKNFENIFENHPAFNLEFLEPNQNLGFAGAINEATKNKKDDFLLILNPDINLKPDTIKKCLSTFQAYSNLSVLAPLLIDPTKNQMDEKYGPKRFPSLLTLLGELPGISKILPNNAIYKFHHYLDDFYLSQSLQNKSGCCEVEQVAGACLFVKQETFVELGGFEAKYYPAWHEDVDFCLKVYERGLVTAVLCDASCDHAGGTSTKSMDKKAFLLIFYRNYVNYWKDHHFGLTKYLGILLISITFMIKRCFSIEFRSNSVLKSLRSALKETWHIMTQ